MIVDNWYIQLMASQCGWNTFWITWRKSLDESCTDLIGRLKQLFKRTVCKAHIFCFLAHPTNMNIISIFYLHFSSFSIQKNQSLIKYVSLAVVSFSFSIYDFLIYIYFFLYSLSMWEPSRLPGVTWSSYCRAMLKELILQTIVNKFSSYLVLNYYNHVPVWPTEICSNLFCENHIYANF